MLTIYNDQIAFLLSHAFTTFPGQKIEQIKFVRSVLGTGLRVSKNLVEAEHERRDPQTQFTTVIARVLKDTPEAY